MFSRPSFLGLALALVAAPAVALPATTASAKASSTTINQVARRLAAETGAHPDPAVTQALRGGGGSAMTQATNPWPCSGVGPSGTDNPSDTASVDVASFGELCSFGVTVFRLGMRDTVVPSAFDDIEVLYDTDDNPNDGYLGAEYVVEGFYDPSVDDILVAVLRTPTADPNAARLVTVGGALARSATVRDLDLAWPSWAMTSIAGVGVRGSVTSGASTDLFGALDTGWVRVPAATVPTPANPWGQSRFVPLDNPTRLLDTRNGIGVPAGKRPPNSNLVVPVRGHAGIPNDPSVQAVVMNVTAVDATGPGYVQVLPTGVPGDYSNLNTDTTGQTIPNLTVVPIGADGSVTIYTQGGAHLLADVSGYFVASGATKGGRYVAAPRPVRIFDSRGAVGTPAGLLVAGTTVTVNPYLVVPPGAASAVVMNVTAVSAGEWGFITAYPTGRPLPDASNLNMVRRGQVIANQVIVPVGPAGTVDLTTSVNTHLIVDVLGYFTADSQPSSTSGLYVPVPPHRARDSRLGYPQAVKPVDQDSVEVGVVARGAVPATGVSAVLMNVTATMAEGSGFVMTYASEDSAPLASTLNYDHTGQTIANSAVVKVGGGFVTFQNVAGKAFLLADTFGYFTA